MLERLHPQIHIIIGAISKVVGQASNGEKYTYGFLPSKCHFFIVCIFLSICIWQIKCHNVFMKNEVMVFCELQHFSVSVAYPTMLLEASINHCGEGEHDAACTRHGEQWCATFQYWVRNLHSLRRRLTLHLGLHHISSHDKTFLRYKIIQKLFK